MAFTEQVKIQPVLDRPAAKKAEEGLSKRFDKVSKRFGGGLNKVLKGSLLGISVGLLSQLLNPLEKVEDRIKALLDQGKSIRDLADQFNTMPQQLKKLQDIASNVGLAPDQLTTMMSSFSQALDTARQEIEKQRQGGDEVSSTTRALAPWVGDVNQDEAAAFFNFIQSISKASPEERRAAERNVLGGIQKGGAKRFIEADFQKEVTQAIQPKNSGNLFDRLETMADIERRGKTKTESDAFYRDAGILNRKMVEDMNLAATREAEKLSNDLRNTESLQKAAQGIEEIKNGLFVIRDLATKGVGLLGDLIGIIKNSRFIKGFFGN